MSWLAAHWFDLVQSTVIVGGLFITARSLHHERQARRSATLLKLTEQHRELWREMITRDDLARILRADVDLSAAPLSKDETVFVTLLFLHLSTAYDAIHAGILREPEGLSLDIRTFFELPIPAAVWAQIQHYQDANFVEFIKCKRFN